MSIIRRPATVEDIMSNLRLHGRPLSVFRKGMTNSGSGGGGGDNGNKKYSYVLDAEPGNLETGFNPDLTPEEMMLMGVFEGKYLNDATAEFPMEWFIGPIALGRLSPAAPDPIRCNLFHIKSRQPLHIWRENGWAPSAQARGTAGKRDDRYHGILADPTTNPDERGWFQWYCRYWLGRRIPALDKIQIGRWRAFRRHAGAIRANCAEGDLECRPRERQALLQWAYDPFI